MDSSFRGEEVPSAATKELTVDSLPHRFSRARHVVAEFVRSHGRGELVDSAVMCATELLANVFRHTPAGRCTLTLHGCAACLRITVSDASHRLPVVREPDWFAESGRGMFLLSRTADAWGADRTADGKDVWVEFRGGTGKAVS